MDVTCLHCATTFEFVDAGPDSPAICPSCGRETALPPSETEAGALAPGSDGEAEVCFHCGAPVTVTDGELIPICDKCRTGLKTHITLREMWIFFVDIRWVGDN